MKEIPTCLTHLSNISTMCASISSAQTVQSCHDHGDPGATREKTSQKPAFSALAAYCLSLNLKVKFCRWMVLMLGRVSRKSCVSPNYPAFDGRESMISTHTNDEEKENTQPLPTSLLPPEGHCHIPSQRIRAQVTQRNAEKQRNRPNDSM